MATLTFFAKIDKISKKTGKIPLCMRVTHLGRKAEASLKADFDAKYLSSWNETVMSFNLSKNKLNDRINSIRNDFAKFEASTQKYH